MLHVNFNAYNKYVTDSLYQWDINRDLVISGLNLPAAPEIHFANANMNRAIVRQSTLNSGVITARIPNSILQEALTVKAYVGVYEGDTFKVIETIEIPVIAKARPIDYVFEDTEGEIYSFKALENTIADLVSPDGQDAVVRLKDLNNGRDVTVWVGTEAEYAALTEIRNNCLYIITDKSTDGENTIISITGGDPNDHESRQTIRYSNGYAECVMTTRFTNLTFTQDFNPFYAWGAARKYVIGGITGKPTSFNVSVDGAQVVSGDELVAGPLVFAMVGGGAVSYDESTNKITTPEIRLFSDFMAQNAVVDLTFRIRWKWK